LLRTDAANLSLVFVAKLKLILGVFLVELQAFVAILSLLRDLMGLSFVFI
jgi:hypothetical protein